MDGDDQLSVARRQKDALPFRLLGQDNAHFAAQVCADCFQGERNDEVSEDYILRVIDLVKEKLNADPHFEGEITGSAQHYLNHWKKDIHGANWLGSRRNERQQTVVTLLPAAKSALAMIFGVDADKSLTTDNAFAEFQRYIQHADARISGDDQHMLENLRAEVQKAQQRLEEFERVGMEPLGEVDNQEIAAVVSSKIIQINEAFGSVVRDLRAHHDYTRRLLQDLSTRPQGDLLFDAMSKGQKLEKTPPFRLASTILDITNSLEQTRQIEKAMLSIAEHCEKHLTESARRRIHDFFGQIARTSREINEQYRKVQQQIATYLENPDFARRNPEYGLLITARELAEDIRNTMAPTERDARLEGLGLCYTEFKRPEAASAIASRLTFKAPVTRIAAAVVPPIANQDNSRMTASLAQAAKQGSYLEPDRVIGRIRDLMKVHGALRLSEVLQHKPLRYGTQEIMLYLNLAATALPSRYDIDHVLTETVEEETGTFTIRAPDPLFSIDGPIADGLAELNVTYDEIHEAAASTTKEPVNV